MKTKITALFVATAGFASAATTTVYSGSSVNLGSSNDNVAFNIAQFNTALGTLTGVTVKVTTSSLVGSFNVANAGGTSLSVGPHTADFRVDDVADNLGYTIQSVEIDPLATTPVTSPAATIPVGENQTYAITLGQGYTVSDQNIAGSFFGVYSGNGNVMFNVRNRLNIAATGSVFTVDSALAYTTTRMAITYTYEVIPEPSAALLGGLGLLCLLRRRR
jgi:hypothetical protein